MTQGVEGYLQDPGVLQLSGDPSPLSSEAGRLAPQGCVCEYFRVVSGQSIQHSHEFLGYPQYPRVASLLRRVQSYEAQNMWWLLLSLQTRLSEKWLV